MKVEYIKDNLVYSFDHHLSESEKTRFYQGSLQGHFERAIEPYDPLLEFKQQVYTKIDEYIQSEITKGFVYKGKLFSMSMNAQINWSNILLIPDNNFPLALMTVDEELTQLPLDEKNAFYQASLNHKYSKLQLGHSLKSTVKACATIAELDALRITIPFA